MLRSFSLLLLVALVSPVSADPPKCQQCPPAVTGQVCPWGGMFGISGSMSVTVEKEKTCPTKAKISNPCAGLIEIMDTTKSPDTFLMAVTALPALGEKGCRALPAVVRNAERLGLLKGLVNGPSTPAHRALLSYVQQVGLTDAPPAPPAPPPPVACYGYSYPTPYAIAPMVPTPPEMVVPPACTAPCKAQTLCVPEKVGPPRVVTPQTDTQE